MDIQVTNIRYPVYSLIFDLIDIDMIFPKYTFIWLVENVRCFDASSGG
jgi:hypothetical protein